MREIMLIDSFTAITYKPADRLMYLSILGQSLNIAPMTCNTITTKITTIADPL